MDSYSPIKLYEISDSYINYMIAGINDPSTGKTPVYRNKVGTQTRKYLALQIQLNGYDYYIPLSSGRKKDYLLDEDDNFVLDENGHKIIRRDFPTNWKITGPSETGEEMVKASIVFGSMIPAPVRVVTKFDVDNEPDRNYRNLLLLELRYLTSKTEEIKNNASIIYNRKIHNSKIPYMAYVVNFKEAEKLADNYSVA